MLININEKQRKEMIFTMYRNRAEMDRYVEENRSEYEKWLRRKQQREAYDRANNLTA